MENGNSGKEERFVLGIDGGGTKTVGCIAAYGGRIKAMAVGAPSNYQVLGASGVRAAIEPLVAELLREAKITSSEISNAVLALSGCGRPEDRIAVENALRVDPPVLPKLRVEHDGLAALAGAFGRGSGVILISGTGVICLGRNADGQVERSGGWGFMLGDEGSGFYIGQQCLIAALKAFDGRGPETVLKSRVEHYFKISNIESLIPIVYRKPMDRGDFAALAPLVFEAASDGDGVARQIVERAGRDLGLLAKAVIHRLGMEQEEVRLALIGNVFRARQWLQPGIETVLAGLADPLRIVQPRFEPVVGSVILALDAAGCLLDEEVLSQLERTAVSSDPRPAD